MHNNGPAPSRTPTDYTSHSNTELITRITHLEKQLRDQTSLLQSLTTFSAATTTSLPLSIARTPARPTPPTPRQPSRSRSRSPRRAKPFDPLQYSTRHIALKFAYLGGRYGGYEHANGNVTAAPTIEEVIWKALRKARLVSPVVAQGADDGFEVCWGERVRRERYSAGRGDDRGGGNGGGGDKVNGKDTGRRTKVRLELNWEGCEYSKCGRTDRGVSAFGQVIGVRVRSNRPLETRPDPDPNGHNPGAEERSAEAVDADDEMPQIDADDLSTDVHAKPFDPIRDELPYISLLNALLPPDIRVLAWCPNPPPAFDARFSCRERRYKYFFTNPAFCPVPGPAGRSEGYLDVEKMRVAAQKLEGLHDFRNLCKVDASKQMSSCVRRVTYADIVEWDGSGDAMVGAHEFDGLATSRSDGSKVYAFCVHGSAFLWHQVRCMAAVLFLVGQGLEQPSIVNELLDIEKNPGRPMYEMADDAPLVLWDCIFPDGDPEAGREMVDSLDWLYAGDEATLPSLSTNPTKSDGKFGVGAVVDELWTQWRGAKMQEILTESLLHLAIGQGDGTSVQRATDRATSSTVASKSQKVFDGSGRARYQGRYVPVMNKPRMASLEVLNSKWLKTRNARQVDSVTISDRTLSKA